MKTKTTQAIHPRRWLVTVEIEPANPKLHDLLSQLKELGFRPAVANAHMHQLAFKSLPVCPKHHHIMAKREKEGDIWFSHPIIDPATGEKHYCRGFETKHGSGWYIDVSFVA